MGSIADEAKNYERTGMSNISELSSIDVSNEIIEEERTNSAGEKYTVKFIVVDAKEYRMPATVLEQLKEQLEENPKLATFKVKRKGTTKEDTSYTVIPLK